MIMQELQIVHDVLMISSRNHLETLILISMRVVIWVVRFPRRGYKIVQIFYQKSTYRVSHIETYFMN